MPTQAYRAVMHTRRRLLAGLGASLFAGCAGFGAGEPPDSWPLSVRNVTSEALAVRVVVRTGESGETVFGPETRTVEPEEGWAVTEVSEPGAYEVTVETSGYYELRETFEWEARGPDGGFGVDVRRGRDGEVALIPSGSAG